MQEFNKKLLNFSFDCIKLTCFRWFLGQNYGISLTGRTTKPKLLLARDRSDSACSAAGLLKEKLYANVVEE